VVARFLVAFDRSLRRERKKRRRYLNATTVDAATAKSILAAWTAQGAEHVGSNEYRGTHYLHGTMPEEIIQLPAGTAMPRGRWQQYRDPRTGERLRLQDIVQVLGAGAKVAAGPNPISEKDRSPTFRSDIPGPTPMVLAAFSVLIFSASSETVAPDSSPCT
jgi:hypothetical protein